MTTSQEPRLGQFFIQVDGADLAPAHMTLLMDVVVEDDLDQPAMAVLRFQDQGYQLIDGDTFQLGSELKLRAANPSGRPAPLFAGEVTALETEQEQSRTTFVVRAYDRSHRLHRGRKTRTFLREGDAAIVERIAREAGLRADVERAPGTHEHLMQDNQTDFAFLRERAARLGYRLRVDDRTLHFRRAEASPPRAPDQEWGATLLRVRTRQTAVAQPSEVQVRGWDPGAKRAIVGRASRPAQESRPGDGRTPAAAAERAFGGSATLDITNQPVATQGEADQLAQAVLNQVAADYLALEATCRGEPALRAGAQVELKGAGRRVSGVYLITATRHELTPEGGYKTTVYVNGRRPNGLLALTGEGRAPRGIEGVVVGIVTNINDPDRRGRVKVKFPSIHDNHESAWARLAAPGAGPERGLFMLPEVNDEVLVAFEYGDINRPYIVGGLWNGRDPTPAEVVAGGKVKTRLLKTRVGHVIELEDDGGGGDGQITLKTKGGHTITLSDSDKKVRISSQGGNTIEIADNERSISVSSQGKIELSGPGGKLAITESGVELTSQSMLKVQANAMLDLKANATVNIQGALVKIN